MSLANNSRDLLQQVERALERVDAGTYGRCESCGDADPEGPAAGLPAGDALRERASSARSVADRPRTGTPARAARAGPACSSRSPSPSCVADVVSKRWSSPSSRASASMRLLGGALLLAVSRNPGAAFSFAEGATVLFTAVAVAVIVVILRTARAAALAAWAVSLGLLLGGASGNLLDRLFRAPGFGRGAVVDFIDFRVWPVFNLADSAIVVGGRARRAAEPARRRARRHPCGRTPEPARRPDRASSADGRVTARRTVPVPEGLDGLRLDAARQPAVRPVAAARPPCSSTAAACASTGGPAARATGCSAGAMLEVDLPSPDPSAGRRRRSSPGLTCCYEDDDVIVVDKPVGVAAHPSPGWEGPTVIGGLAAAGPPASARAGPRSARASCTGSTSAPAASWSSPRASTRTRVLKDAFRHRTVDKRYHALVQGHPDPMTGTIDAPIDRHPTSSYKYAVVQGGRDSVTHYETRRGVPARDAARHPPRDRPHPPDPRAHGGASTTRASATSPTAPTRR